MQSSNRDLCLYRMQSARETLDMANICVQSNHYKDAINRSYYACFHAIRAILAMEQIDFKRHKDVIAYFNKTYVATGLFDKAIGRMLAQLQLKREKSDYDDFYVVSKEEAEIQCDNALLIIKATEFFLLEKYKISIS